VVLKVYSPLGEEIKILVNEVKSEGPHSTYWDGRDNNGNQVSSGLYFYRLETDRYVQTRKMILLR
jgi:flagellar hook assembly protein FlgD